MPPDSIATHFAHFFHTQHFTASYKPILLLGILDAVKHDSGQMHGQYYTIPTATLARFFLKFNYVIYRRFHLRQLQSNQHRVKIYDIIDADFATTTDKMLQDTQISTDTTATISALLLRNVFYALRKDLPAYEFISGHHELLPVKTEIKDEQEFRRLVDVPSITQIGLTQATCDFIVQQYPTLFTATIGALAQFLERLNTLPNLFSKLMIAAGAFYRDRNISAEEKSQLYDLQHHRCFYCDESIAEDHHADHFVPYDFLFDSPIWNMVGACPRCNLKKSDHLVPEPYLQQVEKRNYHADFGQKFHLQLQRWDNDIPFINTQLEQHYYNCKNYFSIINI